MIPMRYPGFIVFITKYVDINTINNCVLLDITVGWLIHL